MLRIFGGDENLGILTDDLQVLGSGALTNRARRMDGINITMLFPFSSLITVNGGFVSPLIAAECNFPSSTRVSLRNCVYGLEDGIAMNAKEAGTECCEATASKSYCDHDINYDTVEPETVWYKICICAPYLFICAADSIPDQL
jgi:hypothetical protein